MKFKSYIHSQISDYFLGIWANTTKPYSYTEEQKKMFLLQSLHGEADRKVPAQPEIFFNPNNNSVRYNGRKLSELPYNLIRSNRFDELYSKVLFNYIFLYAKLSFMPLNSLIADFEDCLVNYKQDKEVILVLDALRLASSLLSASATNLAPQIIGRLLPFRFINSKRFDNVRSLLEKCETDGLENSAFVPAFNCFHSPGGPLVYSLEAHPFGVYGISLMSNDTQLLSVSNKFIIFDLSSGDVVRVVNPQVEGILQAMSLSADKKYCVSFSNNDQIVVYNVIIDDFKVFSRYILPADELRMAKKVTQQNPVPLPPQKSESKPPNSQETTKQSKEKKNSKNKTDSTKKTNNNQTSTKKETELAPTLPPPIKPVEISEPAAPPIEIKIIPDSLFPDQLCGCFAGLNYFVIWSKYYYYVYDKNGRIVKAEKVSYPLIQIEIIDNKSIEMYGVELEIVTRSEDVKDDDEREREELILEYKGFIDDGKISKKASAQLDFKSIYMASSSTRLEMHNCLILTKNKNKLFTCTEIGDNVIQCYKKKKEYCLNTKTNEKFTRNVWKFHRSLDDNLTRILNLVLSNDETYMLAIVSWGFKVLYLLTGQSKPIRLPNGVKNIQIGAKKLTHPAVFSNNNKYVVAGVRDNIYIWETSYGTYLKELDAHYGRIACLLGLFSEGKNLVMTSSMDKTIKVWNLNNIMEEDFHLDHLEKPIERMNVSIAGCIAIVQSRNQLEVYNLMDGQIKYQLCNSPHGTIYNYSTLSTTGSFAASSEAHRLVIWNMEERHASFVGNSPKTNNQIKQLKFHQSDMCLLCAVVETTSGLVTITNYMVPDGEEMFQIEYNLKPETEYKEFIITSDDKYLVVHRNDKKNDVLSMYLAVDGTLSHNFKLTYLYYNPNFLMMVPMYKNPHFIGIIDSDKGHLINVRDKKFVRTIQKWNGHATKDDKYGLYAPTRGGLEVIDLKNGKQVKVLIPKIAEGVFDISTLITPNDKHVIYYHSGRRTIRVFRLEDGKKIADYKSTAKVRQMKCTQDSKSIVIGCEDGTVSMFIIADPFYQDYFDYLKEWRQEQSKLFTREGAPSPTPNGPPPTNFTATFKSFNIFAQQFDFIGNAPPTPEPVEANLEGKENENGEQHNVESKENEILNEAVVENTNLSETNNQTSSEEHHSFSLNDEKQHHDDDADVIIPVSDTQNSAE